MGADSTAERHVERSGSNINIRLIGFYGQRRTAGFTAGNRIGRAQLVGNRMIFAIDPMEPLSWNDKDRNSTRAAQFPAERTMADPYVVDLAIDFIASSTT